MRTVVTCNNLSEVGIVRSLLESEGIETLVPHENTPQPLAGFPAGYPVRVPDGQHERAMELLRTAGYAPNRPPVPEVPVGPVPTKVRIFRWLVLIDAALAIGIWISAQRAGTSLPPDIQRYLDGLASLELWGLGYSVFMVGLSVNLVGSLLLFFRIRAGLWMYAGGILLQTLWMGVFPGGISYGPYAVVGTFELLLAGFITGFAAFDKSVLTTENEIPAGKRVA